MYPLLEEFFIKVSLVFSLICLITFLKEYIENTFPFHTMSDISSYVTSLLVFSVNNLNNFFSILVSFMIFL